jgi:Na+-transporting NADH:ubiquinone oxidoreductase subunit E
VLVPLNLEFFRFILFIIVIAAFVQFVEMVLDRYSPFLYQQLGVFLPLITVNCAILGASLFMVIREYSFVVTIGYGLGSGLGWFLAIISMAGIRQRLARNRIPRGLQGPGITLIITGLMALAFMGFTGVLQGR